MRMRALKKKLKPMISLKLSKKDRKKDQPETIGYDDNKYPWGTRIRFNEELIDKVKILETIGSGTEVNIDAKAFICEVSTNESAEGPGKQGKKNQNVEIQITHIKISDNSGAEASFDED